jgi:tetratricopeptide (TPR) repeat protein
MKQIILHLLLIIFTCNFINAQKIKKTETIVKSTDPLDFIQTSEYQLNAADILDSTKISKKNIEIVKQIMPLLEKEENEKAYQLLKSIDEKDKKNELLILQAILELNTDQLASSSSSLSKYLPYASNDSIKSSIYYMLGTIDLKRLFKINANQNFEKSYELDNKNYRAAMILGWINQQENNIEKAVFYYEKTTEINPNLNNIWNALGWLYQQIGQHEKAKKTFSKIIKDEPDEPFPYNNRSYSNLQLGFTKQALEDVNKSIKLRPENSYAFRNRALVYIKMKDSKKACIDIESALKLGYRAKYGSDLDTIQVENCKN